MKFSTLYKSITLVIALSVSTLSASAAALTFAHEGIIYKTGTSGAKLLELTVQKPGTAVSAGEEAGPAKYTGDIVVPKTLVHGDKTYTVVAVSQAFRGCDATSIALPQGVTLGKFTFRDCANLTKVTLPADLSSMPDFCFQDCKSLSEVAIPKGVTVVGAGIFKGCTSLQRLVFEEGDAPLSLTSEAFSDGAKQALREVIFNRPIGTAFPDLSARPFRSCPALTTFVLGGTSTELPSGAFEGCTKLTDLQINAPIVTYGTSVFANTGISSFKFNEGTATVSASLFQGCKNLKEVTLASTVTTIADMAFMNSAVERVNLPEGLTSVGQMAFSGTDLQGELNLPAQLKRVGIQAFARNSALTAISIPDALAEIGIGAFYGCTSVTKFTVGEGNTTFKAEADGTMVTTDGGKTLFCFAPACTTAQLAGSWTKLAPYAVYGAKGVTAVSLPDCTEYGDYSLAYSGIRDLTLKGMIGRYVASATPVETIEISGGEIPFGVAYNCASLKTVKLTGRVTVVKQDALAGCRSLTDLDRGAILALIETDAFKDSGLKNLTVRSATPAIMSQGVFTPESGITATVPVDAVDTYKAAEGWKLLNIVGDANLAMGPSDDGMPDGLYYAGEDGNIHCLYEKSEGEDVYETNAIHTFQLVNFNSRIYGASAGQRFVYTNTSSVDGDGKMFFLSRLGGQNYQGIVLDNQGGNGYKDPFGITVYNGNMYVTDRNVCIRKVSPNDVALSQSFPSWLENNWMGWYGTAWSYGCIKSGFCITEEPNADNVTVPTYYLLHKYNSPGLFRFTDEHIGDATAKGSVPANSAYLMKLSPIATCMYIDAARGHVYMYIETAGSGENTVKGGLYRFDLAKLKANPEPNNISAINGILVDGSPVKYEGSSTNEHVGISQLSPDETGEYLYWCYRAPTQAEAEANEAQTLTESLAGHYYWADKFDASNPLHQSGIKRIKLGEDNPAVEMVAPGVNGYGVVAVNYKGSTRPAGVTDITVANPEANLTYAAGLLTAGADATVYVYDMSGAVVAAARLAAGQSLNLSHLGNGAYVATANGRALKFVK